MVKGNPKSSATSATRKKHAKRAATQDQPNDSQPLNKDKNPKGKDKKKQEPRQRMYIPPYKPPPPQLDPLDATGLAHTLPAELLVILRSFGKKAEITKVRALEELQSSWVDKCKDGEDESLVHTLMEMVPVWLHYLPAFFVHASRRIRLTAAGLHGSLLEIAPVRDQILFYIKEVATPSQAENILGTWCMVIYDVDKLVSNVALKSWNDVTGRSHPSLLMGEEIFPALISCIEQAALDPLGFYGYLNPPVPVAPSLHLPKKPGSGSAQKESRESRSRADETEETEEDKKARIRCGAIGVIRWLLGLDYHKNLVALLSNLALWSSLCSAEDCPFITLKSFGHSQPVVRKSAWLLLQDVLKLPKEYVHSLLPSLCPAVLRSAWIESDSNVQTIMWQPVLTFLRDYPSCWIIDYSKDLGAEDNNSESGGGSTHDLERSGSQADSTSSSIVYREFLHFLANGCAGSPLQGYPAVIVVVSTIPITVLIEPEPPYTSFFTSMWSVLDQNPSALQRSGASTAFLSSATECVVFFSKRIYNEHDVINAKLNVAPITESHETIAEAIIEEQTERIWNCLLNKRIPVEEKFATAMLGNFLASLFQIRNGFFTAAWDIVNRAVEDSWKSSPVIVATLLQSLRIQFANKVVLETPLISLIKDSVNRSVQEIHFGLANTEHQLQTNRSISFLVNILETFRDDLSIDPAIFEVVDGLLEDYCFPLLKYPAPLVQVYMGVRNSEKHCLRLWHILLTSILDQPQESLVVLGPIFDDALGGRLPSYLRPKADELDNLIAQWVRIVVTDSQEDPGLPLVEKMLRAADTVLSHAGLESVCHTLLSILDQQIRSMLEKGIPEVKMNKLLCLLEVVLDIFPRDSNLEEFGSALSNIFTLGFLLPISSSEYHAQTFDHAQRLWKQWVRHGSERQQDYVFSKLKEQFKALICSTKTRLTPDHIAQVALAQASSVNMDPIVHLLPSGEQYNEMLEGLSQGAIHPSLAVMDPLIPLAIEPEPEPEPIEYDAQGYTPYARAVSSLIWLLSEDRRGAKCHIWALKHILSFTIYASDYQHYPAGRSPLFSPEALNVHLDDLLTKAARITTYLLTLTSQVAGHQHYLEAIMNHHVQDASRDPMAPFLASLASDARESDGVRPLRILKIVLQHVLCDINRDEADRWLKLARKLECDASHMAMTIISSIVASAPEPQSLDRYRNELAASLLGIPASQANEKGLLTLQKLASASPNPDADIIFLPQHRAVNVVKTCQLWISSDVDIDEEVESAMMLVFAPLVPIMQTIPGAHWEFIFDIIESNLENSSINDDLTLVALARALKLVREIQDLAKTNKSLSESWETRRNQILTTVRDMVMVRSDSSGMSFPRSLCKELMLSIVQNLPGSLIDAQSLSKMCHLLTDPSVKVKKMAYPILNIAARKRTEHLVVEAGVDVDSTLRIDLPEELIAILRFTFDEDWEASWKEQAVLGYLLGWMLVLDSFQDASLKVKARYIDQLRNLDLISEEFMPSVLSLLHLKKGITKTFKLDIWSIDEYYVDLYDPGVQTSIALLTAHLYYRALLTVPSLIHNWALDCKDRQVSSTVTSYTSMHFSPVLIRAELEQVIAQSPEIVDDSFKIKVTSSTNEVTAAYAVDEHELEIKLRIPADWPLHKIEVRDVKRVGVEEHRWRAWILAVQQSIWSHNGKVIDSLSLFKKNVTLHFDGQTECSICYSIISPMDGSLPRKPCKTCRNRFHAGCLYKWFNTSHSSSCPLCRTDII